MTTTFLRCGWLSFGLIGVIATSAWGQRPNRQEVPPENRENVEIAGTLKQIGPGLLHVATDAGDQWLVRLEGRPQEMKLAFGGKAEPAFLRNGMLVQFAGTVNKKGQLQEKLDSLIVTSLREGVEVGLFPEASGGNAGGLFSDNKPDEKPKKQPKSEAVPCRVTGYITKIGRTGELTVNCRNATVTASLGEEAKISVDMTDLRLAQPGDKVELRGWYIKNQKGQAWSRDVSISAASVLGETKKKPRESDKEADTKRPAEKPSGTKEAPEKKVNESKTAEDKK
ncbi:MAG TPA: hypothetical protein VFB96_18090 [Pirellulaceae bacterium]|nr:hypothetical protein [Pirellulaceae bacterium]